MTGEQLQAKMKRMRLTQAELSRALGVSQAAISLWIRNERPIPGPVIIAIKHIDPAKVRGKVKNGRPRKAA